MDNVKYLLRGTVISGTVIIATNMPRPPFKLNTVKSTCLKGRTLKNVARQLYTKKAWKKAPIPALMAVVSTTFFTSLYRKRLIKAGNMPNMIRGKSARISDANGAPLIKGENIISTGETALVVALKMLNKPKVRPSIPPQTGPSKIEPMITGICKMVIEIGGIDIKPSGVKASITNKATSNDRVVKRILFLDMFDIILSPYCHSIIKMDAT